MKKCNSNALDIMFLILVIMGGLNWGLVGLTTLYKRSWWKSIAPATPTLKLRLSSQASR